MGDIDLTNPESRKTYLKENLKHLMEGIDSNYGQVLMDELMRRMEATVSEFNEEVKAMLAKLQGKKPTPRDNILAAAQEPVTQTPPSPPVPPAPVMPEAVELEEPETMDFEEALRKVEKPKYAPEPDDEPAAFAEPEPEKKVNEVEIEVDLPEDELSDFERKLRSLTR